jgi:hypothetical protein
VVAMGSGERVGSPPSRLDMQSLLREWCVADPYALPPRVARRR